MFSKKAKTPSSKVTLALRCGGCPAAPGARDRLSSDYSAALDSNEKMKAAPEFPSITSPTRCPTATSSPSATQHRRAPVLQPVQPLRLATGSTSRSTAQTTRSARTRTPRRTPTRTRRTMPPTTSAPSRRTKHPATARSPTSRRCTATATSTTSAARCRRPTRLCKTAHRIHNADLGTSIPSSRGAQTTPPQLPAPDGQLQPGAHHHHPKPRLPPPARLPRAQRAQHLQHQDPAEHQVPRALLQPARHELQSSGT